MATTAQIPHAAPGKICPLHRKDMSKVCHTCPWWCRIIGKNPQTEEMLDDWNCAIGLLPMLLVENAQVSRGTTVAMETFRNGVVQAVGVAVDSVNRRVIDESRHQLR
jgi:hypothetical protein